MRTILSSLCAIALLSGCLEPKPPVCQSVNADAETEAVAMHGDVVDDPVIWMHPANASESLVIGTNKKGGGLEVYDLLGKRLQSLPDGRFNNVDLRYGMPLGAQRLDIVAASKRDDDTLALYAVDVKSRRLMPVASSTIATLEKSYGLCMYHSPVNGAYYVFVNNTFGDVVQIRLEDENGSIGGKTVRRFSVGSQTEGCVVDDAQQRLYIGEEDVGIWRYGAEPDTMQERKNIDTTGNAHLKADVEGLTLYTLPDGEGYLLASSQGDNSYAVYDRKSERYLGSFCISDGSIDGVDETDGIDALSASLGDAYPNGILVVQDGHDTPSGTQNFKIIDMKKILDVLGLPY